MHQERGGLLEEAFYCGLTMVVPDLLYERELESDNGPLLRKLDLGVVALNPDEDPMEASGELSFAALHEGLSRIWNHPRRRLPKPEVMARLQRWAPG
ncbi:MAG: hypothetical protein ACK515_11170 [bacterium]|jgi:hypothetical protein|nr:hypothetical protein [Betaproteobacteria bacterium]